MGEPDLTRCDECLEQYCDECKDKNMTQCDDCGQEFCNDCKDSCMEEVEDSDDYEMLCEGCFSNYEYEKEQEVLARKKPKVEAESAQRLD